MADTAAEQVKSDNTDDIKSVKEEAPFTVEEKFDDEVVLLFDNGQKLFLSRSFLCLASPVFLNMFTLDFKEKQTGVVEMKGKSYSNVLEFLLYLHPNERRQLTDDNVFRILSLAEEYGNTRTIEECKEKLTEMSDKNYQIVKQGSGETTRTKAVTVMLECLAIASLYGYEDLEEKMTTILGKITSHVYAQPKLKEIDSYGDIKGYVSTGFIPDDKTIFDNREECNKAYSALPDKAKLNILHKRLLSIENYKVL